VERLGDAAVTNVQDAVACGRAWAAALASVADPSKAAPPAADAAARSLMSAWVGGLRAIGVTAAAVIDAAAILSCPPHLVEYYAVDLLELLPGRTRPVVLTIKGVVWASPNSSGVLPNVAIVGDQPIAPSKVAGADTVKVSVRPSVQPAALKVALEIATVGAPPVAPVSVSVRLSPANSTPGP
jgi:hypothetical protein